MSDFNNENSHHNTDEVNEPKTFSRRDFLKRSGIAAGGVTGGVLLGGMLAQTPLFRDEEKTATETNTASEDTDMHGNSEDGIVPNFDARTYFSRSQEFETLAAATERIYPETEAGPGAIELGVPYFIDKQCGGQYGQNARVFMQGPFDYKAAGTHSLQSKLTRGQIMLLGVREMLRIAENDHDDSFANLDGDVQDEILRMFESGDATIPGVRSEDFFSLLRKFTLEGVYSDPVYGGNRNYGGWKMMGYPGPRMGWSNEITKEEFQELEPQGLRVYQGGGM